MTKRKTDLEARLKRRFTWVLTFLAILWIVQGVNHLFGMSFSNYGIVPRTFRGLIGIPLSPFIHGSWVHLISNSVPLLILGGFVALRGAAVFAELTAFVAVVGGVGVWVFADLFETSGSHIGASGVIFGYFGFLVARGWYDRSFVAMFVALLAVALYGGLVFGVLPTGQRISWEGHLFGLIAGVLAAKSEKMPK